MADGLVFGIGTLTIGGTAVGVLQNVSIDISTSSAELRGGGSLMPVKVAITERSITGSAEFAKLDPVIIEKILGGSSTGTTTKTITVKDTDKPAEFALVLKEPTDGSNVSITLPRCISTSLGMAFAYDNFMIPSFEFTAMADGTGTVMTLALPTV